MSNKIFEAIQLEAVEGKLTNSTAAFERSVRRWYSKEFSTPLHETFTISWCEILLHYYENALETKEHNEVFDIAVNEYLPEFVSEQDEITKKLDKELIAEQKESIKRKKLKDAEKSSKMGKEVEKLDKSVNKLAKTVEKSQSLTNKPSVPKEFNLKFDDDEDL